MFEGEQAKIEDNFLLGKFELFGFTTSPRGVPQINVLFDVDDDGIEEFIARDKIMRMKKRIMIDNKYWRLSP